MPQWLLRMCGSTASSSRRTSGFVDSTIVSGGSQAMSAPSSSTADAIGERQRLQHVVRDDDDGLADPLLNAAELALQLGPRDRVERAERFVHQQHRRIGRERPRDADPLPLPAGKLRRASACHARR